MYRKLLEIRIRKQNLFKLVLFLSMVSFLISCGTMGIQSSSYTIVYPGIPSGKTYTAYETVFYSKYSFSIQKITIGGRAIRNYSIQNTKTQVFVDVKKNDYEGGSYKLIAKTYGTSMHKGENIVSIKINQKGKVKGISAKIIKKASIHRRQYKLKYKQVQI